MFSGCPGLIYMLCPNVLQLFLTQTYFQVPGHSGVQNIKGARGFQGPLTKKKIRNDEKNLVLIQASKA